MADTYLITGASGFVGGHVVEACLARGGRVNALVRPTSDTAHLKRDGVTLVTGDATDPECLPAALRNVSVVINCAAKVGDWGPVEPYRRVNVDGLRDLLEACRDRPVRRFVHLSSLGVYAAQHHHQTGEDAPLPERHVDAYTQTKVESDHLARRYHREHGVPVVVLRPGFIYGPRDRTVLPRIAENLKNGKVRFIAKGQSALNTTSVRNLVDAIFLAADVPGVDGRAYNVTDGEFVTKRRFFEAVADGLRLPRPRKSLPMWIARIAARVMERRARRRGATAAPRLTQARLKFLGLNLDFSIERARRELGYHPKYGFDETMAEALDWFRRCKL